MKHLTGLFLVLVAMVAVAQERVPADETQKIAAFLVENAAKIKDAQLQTDVDPTKAFALRKDEHAGLVIPDKKLSAELIARAGKTVMPVGQLWFKKVTPIVNGSPAADNMLRIVSVTRDGQNHDLPMFFLGVRKTGDAPELVLYAKEKEPLLALPLTKVVAPQDLPIEFEARKGDDEKRPVVVFTFAGKYQAKLTVGPQE
jgi:hypothetical protein